MSVLAAMSFDSFSTLEMDNPNYVPSEEETFMNPQQLDYFRNRLISWRNQLLHESNETIHTMQDETSGVNPDIVDQASLEAERSLELRSRDRARKLIMKIEEALRRIDEGTYGYCEETGEPIGIRRLQARPIATLCIEAQERHERKERVHQDDWI